MIDAAIERTNVPISFWGKITDPDGNPIPSAEVTYSYSTEQGNGLGVAWSGAKVNKGSVSSDGEGKFSIAGANGSKLMIESLRKDGYIYNAHGSKVFDYSGTTSSGKFVPSELAPIRFVMVPASAAESVVQYRKLLRTPADGTPVHWDLWHGREDSKGHLQITFRRDPVKLEQGKQPSTWAASIEISGGGVIPADPNEETYRAPEYGYAPRVNYPPEQQKRGLPERKFYIQTSDQKYGRLALRIYPEDEGSTVRCYISAVLNPTGSRNLDVAASGPTR